MDFLIAFANSHWLAATFLMWCALWLCWMPLMAMKTCTLLLNRLLRTINIASRGWPPAHLDADGDWKPEPENKK